MHPGTHHALSCLPYLSSPAIQVCNTVRWVCICPCVPLIIVTKFLVRTIEFRVELRGLHPVNYLNLSSFPGAGTVTLFPCGFPDRIQMKTELT